MRYVLLSLIALSLAVGTAQAQVAAPRLAPFGAEDTTANPAVQQWGAPSFVAVTVEQGKYEYMIGGVKAADGDIKTQSAQVRGVWERFSLGAESRNSRLEFDDSATGSTVFKSDASVTQVALAGQIAGMVALGVGQENSKVVDKDVSNATEDTTKGTLPLAGVSVRLADVLFIGAATGTEKVEVAATGDPTYDANRPVQRYGVGYRQAFGSGAVHLEYYQEQKGAYDEPNPPDPPNQLDKSTSDVIVAEVSIRHVLLGVESVSTDLTERYDPVANIKDKSDRKEMRVTVGWVPMQGLAFQLSRYTLEQKKVVPAGSTGSKFTGETTAAGLAWQF